MHSNNRIYSVLNQLFFIAFGLVVGIFLSHVVASPFLYGQETGFKYLKNFTPKEYDHNAQNWDIAQAKNGIIYVANQAGLLEYDGNDWRVIYIGESLTARSLAIAEDGTVYVGGKNEIGYLEPSDKGTLKYISLVEHLEENQKKFSNVWSTHVTKDGIYFRTSYLLIRVNGKEEKGIEVWTEKDPRAFRHAFVHKGELWISIKDVGFHRIVNDKLVLQPGMEELKNDRIVIFVPYDFSRDRKVDRWLVGERNKGLFLYDGNSLKSFPVEKEEELKKKGIYAGVRLSNGEFAVATSGGLFIYDSTGRLKNRYDKNSGLQNEFIRNVLEDSQGNLWLSLNIGISRIECSSPFTVYDDRWGLPGLVLSVHRSGKGLYAGTTNGLYFSDSVTGFRPVAGINRFCRALLPVEDMVLAAGMDGVFLGKEDKFQKIVDGKFYQMKYSRLFPGRIWCGLLGELIAIDRKNGQWTVTQKIDAGKQQVLSIAEDKKGTIWAGTSGGLIKLLFPDPRQKPVVTYYKKGDRGLPGGEIWVSRADGQLILATKEGLLHWSEQKKQFVPYRKLGNQFVNNAVFRIIEDEQNNIWIYSEGFVYRAITSATGSYTVSLQPFRRIPTTAQVNIIYPDSDGTAIWLGTHEGLIWCDLADNKRYSPPFHTFIHQVLANNQTILGGWSGKITSTVFEYKDRNLLFQYSAPSFGAESEIHYQSILEGYDGDWSEWTKDSKRNYTNLNAGNYRFRVKARNAYGFVGKEDEFSFRIKPPMLLTWWAFVFYAVALIGLVYAIIKWRFRYLEQERNKLESMVKDRTRQIHNKNLQLEDQTQQLKAQTHQLEKQTRQLKEQSDKLEESNTMKSRFFANISHEFRTPLTLIMSPLEQMLSQKRNKGEKETLNVMLKSSHRLLSQINRLLDLSRFDSGKMQLRAVNRDIVSYLREILSSFQALAQKKQLEIEFQPESEEMNLYFDPQKMDDVINNLMINAIKFTPAGGSIAVSVSTKESGKYIVISVKDTGVGISRDQMEHIFDRFYQGEHQGMSHPGTGLGLPLVKEIVILHHGTIDVHSKIGQGTEFEILLPLGHAHLEAEDMAVSPDEAIKMQSEKDVGRLYGISGEEPGDIEIDEPGAESPSSPDKSEKSSKPVILVVEDDGDVRKFICKPLRKKYEVVEAVNGKIGIKKAIELVPDLIISDIVMPETGGIELCKTLKSKLETSHIPIILLTARGAQESVLEGYETGANDYIVKPFNEKILLARINNMIELRNQLQLKLQREAIEMPSTIEVSNLDAEFLKKFKSVIEDNLSNEDFNVDEICEKLGIGRSTLFKKIKALTGKGPNQFILSYRLERGAQFLRENWGNITQVALEVGFNSAAYFSKCFKEKFHQSPRSYQVSKTTTT